jgi:Rrf2 family protein
MRFITRDTDYAMRALIFMARIGKEKDRDIVTVDEIIKTQKLPRVFLRRLLQELAKNKILVSYKGKDGGFSFLMPPSKINVIHIIKIFQGEIDLTHCFLKTALCPNIKICAFRKRLKSINAMVNRELETLRISSLI